MMRSADARHGLAVPQRTAALGEALLGRRLELAPVAGAAEPGATLSAPVVDRAGRPVGLLRPVGTAPLGRAPSRASRRQDQQLLDQLARLAQAEREVADELGRIDPVTMLPNRVRFLDDFASGTDGDDLAASELVLVTLAEAKHFNEILRALGHAFAEDFVRAGATVLRGLLPAGWRVYHVSVLSLAFVLPEAGDSGAAPPLILALKQAFAAPLTCQNIPIDTRVGIGLAPLQRGREPAAEGLRTALAAAQASRQGTAGWARYDPKADAAHRRAFRLLHDLKTAIDEPGQLALHFQPRIALADSRCHGAEALLRWRHPELGPISPGEFIPLAEATAVIDPLTAWVIDQAVGEAQGLVRAGLAVGISLNVSPRNLRDQAFADRLLAALRHHDLAPDKLELELTEGSLAADTPHERAQLERLLDAGCRIAIDDFGSGYSNMSYLTWLPADVLKIDQSLIRPLQGDCTASRAASLHLVRSIVGLAHGLGFAVVAEGIETPDCQTLLRDIGCDEGQGFGISRPLPIAELHAWLQSEGRPGAR
jgi:EAL domain-containing protein (putative c-di-GMP-specific phosphodiesterase class I)/GGDEF domain-containing protein